MPKILTVKKAIEKVRAIREKGHSVVLAGGVFDILHIGHVKFLKKAKRKGDFLFVLLESDKSVKKLKGSKRPINQQNHRAYVLGALESVDFIIKLKGVLKNSDYDKIVRRIQPKVIATSANDSYIFHKKRQAKLVGAKIEIVTPRIKNKSTSKILEEYE